MNPRLVPTDLSPSLSHNANPVTGWEPELSGLRASFHPPLIVHVDDDSALLDLVGIVISRRRPYRCVSCEDGREALDVCLECDPALLITDLARPGLNGYELIDRVRAEDRLVALPILVLSAVAPSETPFELLTDRPIRLMRKPFLPRELLAVVDSMLGTFNLPP